MKIAVIGGGAAGFFAAITCKRFYPEYDVSIYEKSSKLLSKVKISGGGRCNVTHACYRNAELVKHYPRGGKFLKKAFRHFSTKDIVEWFEYRSVPLKTEKDHRIFPVSDNSESIVNCLIREARNKGIHIYTRTKVKNFNIFQDHFLLKCNNENENTNIKTHYVIIATGGEPKINNFAWLEDTGHSIVPPVPSLFTFNLHEEAIKKLQGITIPRTSAKVEGTGLQATGSLLITHWGMSGPVILRLSSWGARELYDMNYSFNLLINWTGNNEDWARKILYETKNSYPKKKLHNVNPFELPKRCWIYLLNRADINTSVELSNLDKKDINKLINTLTHDEYKVEGKSTFKEEFVTAGGVDLNDIDPHSMESKKVPGMFFAGEVMNIDAITGGFNFQAAWTTGYIAGKLGK